MPDGTARTTLPTTPRTPRRWLYFGAAVLVLVAAVVAVVLATGAGTKRASESLAMPDKAERAREAATERRRRASEEAALTGRIAHDARILVTAGAVKGPIIGASCTSTGGGSSTNLSSDVGHYDCLAIQRDSHKPHHGHIVEGVRFYAMIDFRTGYYTFGGG